MTIRRAENAYRAARHRAQRASTVRLRFAERRLRHRARRLTQTELAYLAGLRDVLRARGQKVRDLWPD